MRRYIKNFLRSRGVVEYSEQMIYMGSLKRDVPNLRLNNDRFMVAALRMLFDGELSNDEDKRSLNVILKHINNCGQVYNYNYNLNDLKLSELSNKYIDEIKLNSETDRERSSQVQRGNGNGYKIIPIFSFEEAKQYSKYTEWCVSKELDDFKDYTKCGNKLYFCLKDGFEQVQRNDEGAPLNEYGLSMLAVLVDYNGDLSIISTRYNHEHNGENNDNLITVEQLENVLDVNFYDIFKPYTTEEMDELGIILISQAQSLLDSGKEPSEVFETCYEFSEGFSVVFLNNKTNYIDTNHKLLLPNQWFDFCCNFKEGFGQVEIDHKWNFINANGELLSPNQWFDCCLGFSEGFARVKIDQKWNYIDKNNKLLSNKWFDYCYDFYEGFGKVRLDGKVRLYDKFNYIDTNGELLSPNQWFDKIRDFEEGFAEVELNNKRYKINTKGELL